MPAVPRALAVTSAVSTVSNAEIGQWQPIRFYDGTVVQVRYEGELASSALLPPAGRFLGEEFSVGQTNWIWIKPVGSNFPSWVDP